MKKNVKQILFYVVLIAVVVVICAMLFREGTVSMKYSDVVAAFKAEAVEEFQIDKNNVLTMVLRDGSEAAKTFAISSEKKVCKTK